MYDLIIIGSGAAGHSAALDAARNKMKTLLIERYMNRLGGTCLNEGCIPLKGLLHYSVHEKNYTAIRDSVMKKIAFLREGLRSRLRNAGIDLLEGTARFISSSEIECGGKTFTAKNIIIAAGSSPKRFFPNAPVSSPETIFTLDHTPSNALIIGGGVIGCEYASFLNNLGTSVDIAETMPTILYGSDEEAVRTLSREFKKKKITLFENCRIKEIKADRSVILQTGDTEQTKSYDIIIEATGRKPDTASLSLTSAGISLDEKGFIVVSDSLQTNIPGIYACGDCIATPMLAYTASNEAEHIIQHILTGKVHKINYSTLPLLVFSHPQLGSVGIREKDALEQGLDVKTVKFFFKALGKSYVEGKDAGYLKLIIDKTKDAIIGASIVGDEASEILNELSIIISSGINNAQLRESIHIHPSYSEIITECIKNWI
jgi:dihydrolipoamide dehydrogenase